MRSTGVDPQAIQDQARQMFRRALAGWASDLMALRREGLDSPGPRRGRALVLQLPRIDPRALGQTQGATTRRAA